MEVQQLLLDGYSLMVVLLIVLPMQLCLEYLVQPMGLEMEAQHLIFQILNDVLRLAEIVDNLNLMY